MPYLSFVELTKKVHLINDLILSDMTCENEGDVAAAEKLNFNRHLLSTVHWFSRISWSNKKRYLLALLTDVRSAWTLSLLLKSIWNCRPKDAVLSASDPNVWSSYDQVPLDHNRTAQPGATLAIAMKNDRVWFLSLEPESQAIVLSELLAVSGGPVMWEVFKQAEKIYENYRDVQLRDLKECIVVNEQTQAADKTQPATAAKGKKDNAPQYQKSGTFDKMAPAVSTPAQKELDANLTGWNATIKFLKDSVKLEELEMTFTDGTKRKIWKVNRPKPEIFETVDFVQLLPASIGKRILSYLPRSNLADYAKVNKYWTYLVDDFKAELAARVKINSDLEKLQELMLRHDDSSMETVDLGTVQRSSQAITSVGPSFKARHFAPSVRASERSAGALSFRHMLSDKLNKTTVARKPFRNLAELNQRLEWRGAVDDNLSSWCRNIIKQTESPKKPDKLSCDVPEPIKDVLQLSNMHFPCPNMKTKLEVPLETPLCKDPSLVKGPKPKRNISSGTVFEAPRHHGAEKYSLWTKDFSKLYPPIDPLYDRLRVYVRWVWAELAGRHAGLRYHSQSCIERRIAFKETMAVAFYESRAVVKLLKMKSIAATKRFNIPVSFIKLSKAEGGMVPLMITSNFYYGANSDIAKKNQLFHTLKSSRLLNVKKGV